LAGVTRREAAGVTRLRLDACDGWKNSELTCDRLGVFFLNSPLVLVNPGSVSCSCSMVLFPSVSSTSRPDSTKCFVYRGGTVPLSDGDINNHSNLYCHSDSYCHCITYCDSNA